MVEYGNIERLWTFIQEKGHEVLEENDEYCVGVDIGTANVVSVVTNKNGAPVAGALTPARVVKEGLIMDYYGAVKIVAAQINALGERIGAKLKISASAIPPQTETGNIKVTRNILESVGLDVLNIVDEPVAAALALDIRDGIVVDVGGGTTGVSILKDGAVVYSADEPTGGFQMDLVLSGHFGIDLDKAVEMKLNPEKQKDLFSVLRPVFEKVASIVMNHCKDSDADTIYMVGGASSFPGFENLMHNETKKNVVLPRHSLLATPLGIALSCIKRPELE